MAREHANTGALVDSYLFVIDPNNRLAHFNSPNKEIRINSSTEDLLEEVMHSAVLYNQVNVKVHFYLF